MAYMKIIETSQTWTCPEDGDYEIICVAGGQGGIYAVGQVWNDGGATSFGNYLTASGHFSNKPMKYYNSTNSVFVDVYKINSYNGYTLKDCYTVNSDFMRAAVGYGAGGSSLTENCNGRPGKLQMTHITLTAGTSIACTIGAGGLAVRKMIDTTAASLACSDGYDGVIVIREI